MRQSTSQMDNVLVFAGDRVSRFMRSDLVGLWLPRICLGLFALLVAGIAALNAYKPAHNWDIAPYIAVAMDDGELSVRELHEKSWSLVRQHASPGQMYTLQAGNPYNAHQYAHPEDFYSQLPMYRVKVGYIAALQFLGRYMDMVDATTVISVGSAVVFGLICLWWMGAHGFAQSAPLAGTVLLLIGFHNHAGMANPDMMVSALTMIGIYALVKQRTALAVATLFAAFLVRPDNLVLLCALAIVSALFAFERRAMIGLFVLSLACYFAFTSAIDHPGWWPHFVFSNIELQNSMAGFEPDFSLGTYIKGLLRGISVALRFNNWPMIVALLVMAALMLATRHGAPQRRAAIVGAALILTLGAKFVVFPLPDDRVYFSIIAPLLFIVLEWWRPAFDGKHSDSATPPA